MKAETLSTEQFQAVETTLEDLRACYENALKKAFDSDNLIDKAGRNSLRYAIDTLNIHLELARRRWELGCAEMAGAYGK